MNFDTQIEHATHTQLRLHEEHKKRHPAPPIRIPIRESAPPDIAPPDQRKEFIEMLLAGIPVETKFTPELATEIISYIVQEYGSRTIAVKKIQAAVAAKYNIRVADIVSGRRTRNIVRPRQIAMYLTKMLTPRALTDIGARFGGKDHTTVIHAIRKIEFLRSFDTDLADEISEITASLSAAAHKVTNDARMV